MRMAIAFPASVVFTLMTSGAMAETEQRSFEISAGGRFALDADWGKVDVKTWDRDAVDVVVERSEKFDQLEFDDEGDTVTVRARKDDTGIRSWCGRVSSDLHTAAPVSESKSALVTPVNGGGPKLTLRTTGGSIRLRMP